MSTTPEWRQFRNTPYEVSDDGRVRTAAGIAIKHCSDCDGYCTVGLTIPNDKRRTFQVARLVLEAFVGLLRT